MTTHSMMLPTQTRSTTSTESTSAAATPEIPEQLQQIAVSLQQLVEDQRRLHLQLGQSFVAAHKQQQNGLQEIHRRLDDLEQSRQPPSEQPANHPMSSDQRPALFSPAPTIPKFRNKTLKHPVKFLEELDKYFKKMKIPPQDQLDIVLEALEEEAQDWASIFQVSWSTFADFRYDFLQSFWSEQEQMQLRHRITNQHWRAGTRTMEAHFTHYLGQARLLTTRIPDDLLVAELIKHFPSNIQSLWSLHPNKTIAAAAEFLRQQDNIFSAQESHASIPPKFPRLDRSYSAVPPLISRRPPGNATRTDH